MQTYGFQGCCGANINVGFTCSPEQVEKELEVYKKSRSYNVVGINVVMLNDGQKLTYHDVLIKCGWRLMINGAHNFNHDSRIYMYTYVHRPERANPDLYSGSESSEDY